MVGRARERGLLALDVVDFRQWATDRHRSVDDTPYGGGAGMVLAPIPIAAAMDATIGAPGKPGRPRTFFMSPRGRRLDQRLAEELAHEPGFAIVCGHYEALDQRVIDTRIDEEISLGDFVLTGGEIPAMAMVDAIVRLLPGVLGNDHSSVEESFSQDLLEAPHYTRPAIWEGREIPAVLTSGNHADVAAWREAQALALTRERRPDLYAHWLLDPAMIRRLARRARPFALVRMQGPEMEVIFASTAVRTLPEWEQNLRKSRYEQGLQPGVRLVEFRDLRSANEDADRAALRAEAAAALAAVPSQSPTGLFLRALLRA